MTRKQLEREIENNLAGKPATYLCNTSNGKKMTAVLKAFNVWHRIDKLSKTLGQLYKERQAECCAYDLWLEKINGKPVTFGLAGYVTRGMDGELVPGVELCFSRNENVVYEACRRLEEEIWLPTGLLMSQEVFDEANQQDAIATK
jgi:hypothetical protein